MVRDGRDGAVRIGGRYRGALVDLHAIGVVLGGHDRTLAVVGVAAGTAVGVCCRAAARSIGLERFAARAAVRLLPGIAGRGAVRGVLQRDGITAAVVFGLARAAVRVDRGDAGTAIGIFHRRAGRCTRRVERLRSGIARSVRDVAARAAIGIFRRA